MGLVTRQSKKIDDLFAKLAKEPITKEKKPKDDSQDQTKKKKEK